MYEKENTIERERQDVRKLKSILELDYIRAVARCLLTEIEAGNFEISERLLDKIHTLHKDAKAIATDHETFDVFQLTTGDEL